MGLDCFFFFFIVDYAQVGLNYFNLLTQLSKIDKSFLPLLFQV